MVRVLRSSRVTGLTARRLACSTFVPRFSLCYARFARLFRRSRCARPSLCCSLRSRLARFARFCRRPRRLGSLLFLASLVASSLRSPLDGRTSSTIFVGRSRSLTVPAPEVRHYGYAIRNAGDAGARLSLDFVVGVHHLSVSGFVFALTQGSHGSSARLLPEFLNTLVIHLALAVILVALIRRSATCETYDYGTIPRLLFAPTVYDYDSPSPFVSSIPFRCGTDYRAKP